jgi:hypothetical protein
MSWIYLILGVWIFVSPWLLGFSESLVGLWSNLAVGLILVIAAIYGMSSGKG